MPGDPVASQELRVADSALPGRGSVAAGSLPTPGHTGMKEPASLPFSQQVDPITLVQVLVRESGRLLSATMPLGATIEDTPLASRAPRGAGVSPIPRAPEPTTDGGREPSAAGSPTLRTAPKAHHATVEPRIHPEHLPPVTGSGASPDTSTTQPGGGLPKSNGAGPYEGHRSSLDIASERNRRRIAPSTGGTQSNPFSIGPDWSQLDGLTGTSVLAWPIALPNASLLRQPDDEKVEPRVSPGSAWHPSGLSVPSEASTELGVSLPVSPLFDPHQIRSEFPILQQRVNGRPLVWLDNAATTQKPKEVIQRLTTFYEQENSNIHRAAHTLAARSTDAYEKARDTVRDFIGAPSTDSIVFVRGATEAINLVAQTFGRQHVESGDEILITWLEHHANIVPWQQLCVEKGARLRVAPVDNHGQIMLEEYERLLSSRTKLVALTQVSNALGTITPAREMIEMAHRRGARVLLDGAQGVSHMPVSVQDLDCDFYVFSGHKVFAPTGIGVLYGKPDLLETLPPWQGGGNMIQDVTHERTTFHGAPARFEAGTGNIADAVGLGAALRWLSRQGIARVQRYEHELLRYATHRLLEVPGLRLIGTAQEKAGVLSFTLDGHKTETVGGLLDKEGIAVRSGHHCAQPILRRFGVEATVRASLAPYNTTEDIDALVSALCRLQGGRST